VDAASISSVERVSHLIDSLCRPQASTTRQTSSYQNTKEEIFFSSFFFFFLKNKASVCSSAPFKVQPIHHPSHSRDLALARLIKLQRQVASKKKKEKKEKKKKTKEKEKGKRKKNKRKRKLVPRSRHSFCTTSVTKYLPILFSFSLGKKLFFCDGAAAVAVP
jgi:hypothetical protein